jgi:hypothetical protein
MVAAGRVVVPLALAAARRAAGTRERHLTTGVPGPGPVDVLTGVDGSPQAAAALAIALDMLGPRVGRPTLVAVRERTHRSRRGTGPRRCRPNSSARGESAAAQGAG